MDTGSSRGPGIIDCDIREQATLSELAPFIEHRWQWAVTQNEWTPDMRSAFAIGDRIPAFHRDADLGNLATLDPLPGGSDVNELHEFLESDHRVGILTGSWNVSALHPAWSEFKTALNRAYNDWQIEKWLSREPGVRGSIHVNVHDVNGAVAEIERLGCDDRFVQVMVYMGRSAVGEPEYHRIYEAAAEHDLPVAFRASANAPSAFGGYSYYIEDALLRAQSIQSTLVTLVFEGVFDKLPKLKVILIGAGFSWLPSMLGRADQHLKQLHSEVPWVKRFPSEIVRSQVKLVTTPGEGLSGETVRKCLELIGSEEVICFGSGYPGQDHVSIDGGVPVELGTELRERMLRTNAASVYDRRIANWLGTKDSAPAVGKVS